MNTTTRHSHSRARVWTDLDLELFHDGELDDATGAALAADLREDGALRERLSAIAAIDIKLKTALSSGVTAVKPGTVRGSRVAHAGWRLALAAGISVAALSMLVIMLAGPRARHSAPLELAGNEQGQHPGDAANDDAIATSGSGYSVARTVVSVAMRRSSGAASDRPSPKGQTTTVQVAESPVVEGQNAARQLGPGQTGVSVERVRRTLQAALEQGRIADARRIVDGAPASIRGQLLDELGRVLLSARSAETMLSLLSDEDQVEACRRWIAADGGTMRPLAVLRLSELGERPDLKPRVQLAVAELLREVPGARTSLMGSLAWAVRAAESDRG